jgi:serine/threonine-protein kinase
MISLGTKLGRYEVRSKIGEGGMGEVYLAQDVKLDRKVALKILPAEFAVNQNRMRRFVQEAKAASALNHPNIITIYEIEETESGHFIATEFIEGETLRARMRRATIKLGETLDIGAQIASALSAAHAAGIVHRDIKPENIMLRLDGIVKVLDFGLAKLTESGHVGIDTEAPTRAAIKTEPGVVMGTAVYMSPEQARGLQVDARTDIFSLGVVLYEMVAGCLPFEGSNANEVLSDILSDKEPPPLARFARDIPRELEHIVSKALRKDREERYQTVKDMLIDLKDLRRELELQIQLERTVPPELQAAAGAQTSGDWEAVSAAQTSAAPTVKSARATSSAEYLVAAIRLHRRGVALITAALVLALAGLVYYFYFGRPIGAIDSIAVLPLANESGDPNTEYLSDGITESIISNLSQLRQLKVMARSTVFRFKGKEVDPQKVGHDLNVRAVLTGRLLQRGDSLVIRTELTNVADGTQLWGAEYDRKVSDVLAVQQEISREISEKLRLKLTGEEEKRLSGHNTPSVEAYQFYLRGRYFWNKRTAEGLKKAIDEFQQAIERDPNYALGYVGLADCYGLLEEYAGVPASESLPKAKAAADHAIQLDDSLCEAHTSLAFAFFQLWKWAEAEAEFKRAISLNRNYATAYHWFSIYFRTKRQFDDSMREIKRAQELDPLSSVIGQNVAEVYLLQNDLTSAIEECNRVIELDPSFPGTHDELGFAYLKQQRYEEAIAEFQKTVDLSGRTSRYLSDLGYCFAVTGRRAEAQAILKELEERYKRRESVGNYLAGVYAGLGDKDQAFAWLEKDFELRSGQLPWRITRWFTFEALRSDPRYADLVRRVGLQP